MIVPKRIYQMNLLHRSVSVYCYLCDKANKKGECFPAVSTIAGDLHISRRTVFRALADLKNAGLLVRVKRHRTYGGLSSNLYRIVGDKDV